MTDNELKEFTKGVYNNTITNIKFGRGSEDNTDNKHNKNVIACIRMINSCLAYNHILEKTTSVNDMSVEEKQKVVSMVMENKYIKEYVKKYLNGDNKFMTWLVWTQLGSIHHIECGNGGYDLDDLNNYNSIIWNDMVIN